MKFLHYVRHAEANDGWLTPEGLKNTSWKMPTGYTDLFYGPEPLSLQSAIAAAAHQRKLEQIYPPISEVGTATLLGQILTADVIRLSQQGEPMLKILSQIHSPAQLDEWAKLALQGVQKMLDLMPDRQSSNGICLGYEPIIVLAAQALGKKNIPCLGPLAGLTFALHQTKIEIIDQFNSPR